MIIRKKEWNIDIVQQNAKCNIYWALTFYKM